MYPHVQVLNNMFSKVLKCNHVDNVSKLIREEEDPGICYLDMIKEMGYIWFCFECDPVQFKTETFGEGVTEANFDEVPDGCRYIKCALEYSEYRINVTINDEEGNEKYTRTFEHLPEDSEEGMD